MMNPEQLHKLREERGLTIYTNNKKIETKRQQNLIGQTPNKTFHNVGILIFYIMPTNFVNPVSSTVFS
jgi:hypothetical protein